MLKARGTCCQICKKMNKYQAEIIRRFLNILLAPGRYDGDVDKVVYVSPCSWRRVAKLLAPVSKELAEIATLAENSKVEIRHGNNGDISVAKYKDGLVLENPVKILQTNTRTIACAWEKTLNLVVEPYED